MKIFIECDCEILKATLTSFLAPYLTNKESAQIIISDTNIITDKPNFVIGTDITLPFTKAQLEANLADFTRKNTTNMRNFQSALDEILLRFKSDLIELFKEYGK